MAVPAEAARGRLGLPGGVDFGRLWAAKTVSAVGSGVGSVAGPLAAGGWLGGLPRRPVLVWTDLGRGALLLAIPLLAIGGLLSIEWLYLATFLVGVLAVTSDIASTTYAPSLVRRDELVEANAKLQVSGSAANVAGPVVAGPLVQAFGAPLVVGIDALSFLVAGLLTSRIAAAETPPPPRARADMRHEIAEGWRALWDEPIVRPVVLATMVAALGGGVVQTVYVLYATRELGL